MTQTRVVTCPYCNSKTIVTSVQGKYTAEYYQNLLQKYIIHVGMIEGASYLEVGWEDESCFTPEEWAHLQVLAQEVTV